MLHSMTAFHRLDVPAPWGSLSWELRSVNHRWLDVSMRLPDGLRRLEPAIREAASSQLKRGKVDVGLRIERGERAAGRLDWAGVDHWLRQLNGVQARAEALGRSTAAVDPIALLNLPGVMQASVVEPALVEEQALASLPEAISGLVEARAREGQRLQALLRERLSGLKTLADQVRRFLPAIREAQRERLQTRLTELAVSTEPGRLEQELALVALRMDVDEELDRLDSHLTELDHVLGRSGAVGRRLDFLVQELHREANTLGSKSVAIDTSNAAIDMKVLIEQIREQVQNIE